MDKRHVCSNAIFPSLLVHTVEPVSKTILLGPGGPGIELDRVIHWAILTLGPGADIKLQSLLN